MRFLILPLMISTVSWAATSVTAKIEQPSVDRTKYTYSITGATAGQELHLHLKIDISFASPLQGSTMQRLSPLPTGCEDPCYGGTPTAAQPALTLILDAPFSDTASAAVAWSTSDSSQGTVVAPVTAFDSNFFNVLIGAGTLVTTRSATDYQVLQNTNTLSATGIGRNHVDLLVGGSFNLGMHRAFFKHLSAFISLKFTPGSTDTINGFVFGGGYRMTKYLDIIAGVGLTPHSEPAIGLRRVAYNLVANNPNDPLFTGFIAQDLLLNRGQAAFDGFPLQRDGKPIYTGNPLETHYRAGFFIGVAFPLNIRTALAGVK